MNKTIKILLGLLFLQLLITFGLFYNSGLITPPPESQLLLNIAKNDIKKITLTGPGNNQVVLEKTEDLWGLANYNFPANQAQINQLLDRLLETKLGTKISKQKTSHDRLRVSDTGFERKVDLLTVDGNTEIIYFGSAPSLRQSHARLSEDDNVYVVKFSANDIDIQSNDWIKKDIFVIKSQNIDSVSFDKIVLSRSFVDNKSINENDTEPLTKESAVVWTVSGLKNKQLSNDAATNFINKIADMRINGIASKETIEKIDKSKKSKKFIITMKDGNRITYQLSKITGEEDFLLTTSQENGTFRLPPLSGKDLINSSSISFLAGEQEKNLDD